MGVTALWISPEDENVEENAGFSSYHGYWTQDFEAPNPHFGDLWALRTMVDEAHARGFKVILDLVTNHVGPVFFYDINQNRQPDEFGIGQGGEIVPLGQAESGSSLVRITEWDPDFASEGIQAWTSLGPSGGAPIVFARDPAQNRMPPRPEIFARPESYNRKGRVTVWTNPGACACPSWGCAWDDPCRREQELLGDFPGGLKDLDTTRADVRDALAAAFARWLDIGDFDGLRLDTLKHVEPEFWDDFCPRLRRHAAARGKHNLFIFGEAFDGDDRLLGAYTQGEGVDGVAYFSQYYTFFRQALLAPTTRTCELERLVCQRLGCAADPCGEGGAIAALYSDVPRAHGVVDEAGEPLAPRAMPVGFFANHDVGRLQFFMPREWSAAERRRTLLLASTYLLTMDGVPALYYGTEQELDGGNDPANRETLWAPPAHAPWGPFDTHNPTFVHLQRLIRLRAEHVALRRGAVQVRWSTRQPSGDDEGLFAFERVHPTERVLVVVNLSFAGERRTRGGGSTMPVGFPPGTTLVDLLAPETRFVVESSGCGVQPGGGCVEITVPARQARLLAAAN